MVSTVIMSVKVAVTKLDSPETAFDPTVFINSFFLHKMPFMKKVEYFHIPIRYILVSC